MSRTWEELLAEAVAHLDVMHRHLERGSLADATVADAVALRLAAMIEALHRGTPDLTTALFGEDWPVIWGMRNRIAHGYAWIDIETVRVTVEEDLPTVEAALRGLLRQLTEPEEAP